MDELVKIVSQRTGLPERQARDAAQTVIGFLKDRLPKPIASQIDSALGGGGGQTGASGLASKVSGMFGGKK